MTVSSTINVLKSICIKARKATATFHTTLH